MALRFLSGARSNREPPAPSVVAVGFVYVVLHYKPICFNVKHYFNIKKLVDKKNGFCYYAAMINTDLLEKRRKKLKITKYRMADYLGMSRQSYYTIINKKSTSLKTIDKIAGILGLKSKDIIM